MPTPPSPETLTHLVLAGGLLIGLALGAVTQLTRFCTMGALADWFSYGGVARLLMWLLAVAVGTAGIQGLLAAGWLDGTRTLAWSPRLQWLSCAVGGGLFGFGMVLASGCPQRNLVRAGTGSLRAWVTLATVALTAQMTLRGLLALPRTRWLDSQAIELARPQDLGSLLAAVLPISAPALRLVLCVLLGLATAALLWRHRAALQPQQLAGGAAVGALLVAALALTGHVGYLAEHPETLEPAYLATLSHRPEALTFIAPMAGALDLLTLWTDQSTRLSFGVSLALGVVLGGGLCAWRQGQWRLEGFADAADLRRHLGGAVLMGFGGVTALGCSIGQGVSGLALQSAGAVLAVAGLVAGSGLAVRRQLRQADCAGG